MGQPDGRGDMHRPFAGELELAPAQGTRNGLNTNTVTLMLTWSHHFGQFSG